MLIVSTLPSAAALGSSVPVDAFGAEEASAFLAAGTGLDDEAGAAAVAAVLGHTPLALALAVPVIAGQHVGYQWYLDRLQATPADVSLTGDHGQSHPHGIARAVLLSLQAVRAGDRTGICIRALEIMAILSPAGVRRELLHVAGRAGVLASSGRRVAAAMTDRALAWLSDRSLLTFSLDGQTVIIHRLVARLICEEMARRQRLAETCWAAASVLEAYASALAASQDRPAVRNIPQQVTALLDNTTGPAGEADEELAELLLRLRFVALYHLIELGDSTSQAIAIGESLTSDLETLLGPDDPDTLNSRNSLAAAYLAAGRTAQAIPLFEQILAVRQRLLGPGHPDTLTSQNNLAAAYQDAGRVAEAIQVYEQTLAVRERLLGVGHPSTLNSRGNLAAAYQDAGRVAEAIPLFEQCLADQEQMLGPDHSDTRTSRMNLAAAYREGGRAADAIRLLEQISDGRRVLGADRADAWASGTSLANAYLNRSLIPEPISPTGRASAAWESRPPAEAVAHVRPSGLRRPPANPVRRLFLLDFADPPPIRSGVCFLTVLHARLPS